MLIRGGGATGKVRFFNEASMGQTATTTKKLWINTGTPENLRITVNGKRVTLPGGAPQVFVVSPRARHLLCLIYERTAIARPRYLELGTNV